MREATNAIEVVRISDNHVFKADSREQAIEILVKEYHDATNVIGEMLEDYSIKGLSVIAVVELWAELMKMYEGDTIVQIYGGHGEDTLFEEIKKAEDNGDLTVIV